MTSGVVDEDFPAPDRVEVNGPRVATGFDFPGCSNWNGPADLCTCETWDPPSCQVCREDINDGEMIVELVEEFGPPYEETDYAVRHQECNEKADKPWVATEEGES